MHHQRKGSSSTTVRLWRFATIAATILLALIFGHAQADDAIDVGNLMPGGDFSEIRHVCDGYSLGVANDTPDGPRVATIFTTADGLKSFGTLEGNEEATSEPRACNGNEVVGISDTSTDQEHHPWRFISGMPGIQDLGSPGIVGDATGVNSDGWISGYQFPLGNSDQLMGTVFIPVTAGVNPADQGYTFTTVTDDSNATVGYMVEVGAPPGFTQSVLLGIDDTGLAFGYALTADGQFDTPIAWTYAAGLYDIGSIGASNGNRAFAGKNGVVVGSTCSMPGSCLPFYYTILGGRTQVPTLGGSAAQATLIDDDGNMKGDSLTTGDAENHNFAFNIYEDTTPTDLDDALGEGANVNGVDDGEYVGQNGGDGNSFARASSTRHAFRLKRGSSTPEILENPLGGDYGNANSIKDGTVGGSGTDAEGHERGLIWMANPCGAPLNTCRASQKSSISIKDRANNKKDAIQFKFLKGDSTSLTEFGDPTTTTSYTLCVYAGTTAAMTYVELPASASTWTATTKLKDKSGSPNGIKVKATLSPSANDKTKIIVKAQGPNLPDPTLGSLSLPVTVQLTGNGECWGATFSSGSVTKNDASEFAAKQ